MALAADWYPVALAEGLEAGASAPARLLGAEIVVWRDMAGQAHVWQDRCPHRGMRLSFGFVRGNALACLYHGWRYDTAGRCRFIPAHPQLDVPDTIRVPRYPVREACGMVWAQAAQGATFPDDAWPVAGTASAVDSAQSGRAASRHAVPNGATFPTSEGDGPRPSVVAVRSLYVDRPADTVLSHLRDHCAAAQQGDAPALTTFKLSGSRVYGGLQPVAATASALHLVAETGADRRAIALWAVDLRRALESVAPATEGEARP